MSIKSSNRVNTVMFSKALDRVDNELLEKALPGGRLTSP